MLCMQYDSVTYSESEEIQMLHKRNLESRNRSSLGKSGVDRLTLPLLLQGSKRPAGCHCLIQSICNKNICFFAFYGMREGLREATVVKAISDHTCPHLQTSA